MNHIKHLLDKNDDYERAHHLVDVEGLSSPRVCNLLHDLVAAMGEEDVYLEIGTWRGRTLCSAIVGNEGKRCVACDKFRFWGKWTGLGIIAKRKLLRNVARYGEGGAEVTFHHMDSRALFGRGLVPDGVRVYFYDGDHSYEGTRHGVVSVAPCLRRESYLIMDDWNDEAIRRATFDGLDEAGLEVAWMRELEGINGDESGWWNGVGAFYLLRRDATGS